MGAEDRAMAWKQARVYCWVALATGLFFVTMGSAQEKQIVEPSSKVKATPQNGKSPVLVDAPRVSTDAAIHDAAREAAKKQAGDNAIPDQPGNADVVEFHAAEPVTASSSTGAAPAKTPKKGLLENVHGSVYGAASAKGPQTHAEGAAIGASSKSGKSAIYVETNDARTSPPH